MAELSKKELNKLLDLLPAGYINTIHEKISKAVSIRQVRNVLNGESKDSHGIIEIALELAEEEKKRLDVTKQRISKL